MTLAHNNLTFGAALLGVVLLAFGLRYYGHQWDLGQMLHPDERYLAMVAIKLKPPESLGEYLDPKRSTLSPYNHEEKDFVYGSFPLTLHKLVFTSATKSFYKSFVFRGRVLSAIADTITTGLIMLLVWHLRTLHTLSHWVVPLSGLLYALAVLPIQLSHFFTVDSFTVCFSIAAIVAAVYQHHRARTAYLILAGVGSGLALGCKVTAAIYLIPVGLLVLFGRSSLTDSDRLVWRLGERVTSLLLIVLTSYLVLRFASPSYFQSGALWDPRLDRIFISALERLRRFSTPDVWFPPGIQWIDKTPIWFSLKNLALYGLGLPSFTLAILGAVYLLVQRSRATLILMVATAGIFLFFGLQYVQTMRYHYFLYPMLAAAGGVGWHWILQISPRRLPKGIIALGLIVAVSVWPLSFMSIYARPHTRVAATHWIFENVPPGSKLAGEHWDDKLPLRLGSRFFKYKTLELPIYDRRSSTKNRKISELLAQADYVVLSSQRGFKSIAIVPDRYPFMTKLYQDLFNQSGDFELVYEGYSHPTLDLGFYAFQFNDQSAEEAFTVYDHPPVYIFARKWAR